MAERIGFPFSAAATGPRGAVITPERGGRGAQAIT